MNFLESSLKPKSSLWYYFLGIIIALIAANFIGALPYVCVIFFQGLKNGFTIQEISANISNVEVLGVSKNLALALILLSFVIGLLVLIPLIKAFSKRTVKEVINGTQRIRWSRFFWGAAFWSIIMVIITFIDYLVNPDNFTINFNPSAFIVLVFISFILLPIQTSFEEISFRGYLAQGIAGATKSRIWSIFIPAILFGLMHSFNPEVAKYGFSAMMPQYIFFGVIFGLIATLDDGIELPMGIHAANNIFLSLFITNQSSALQTNAILTQLTIDPMREFFVLILTCIVAVIFFAKKYNWNFSILLERVSATNESDSKEI